jgi:cyclopropane fatty-acyl-phospholipid synthase-like methyltransferase
VTIEIIQGVAAEFGSTNRPLAILEVGCSTGNLLKHLHRMIPNTKLTGIDLSKEEVEECLRDPELSELSFKQLGAHQLSEAGRFGVIVYNAILGCLDEKTFEASIRNAASSLNDKGCIVAFDYFSSYEQDICFTEYSKEFPKGLTWNIRSHSKVDGILESASFDVAVFKPFFMPMDLERSPERSSIRTHTIKDDSGRRMSFRGTLYQPWCHLLASKK